MTAPADRLLAAADLLDELAGEATEGPWFNTRDGEVKNAKNWDVVDRMGAGTKDARYIALMGPEVGKQQAVMLRAFGTAVEREWRGFHEMWKTEQRVRMLNDRMPGLVEALALADLLLAGAP